MDWGVQLLKQRYVKDLRVVTLTSCCTTRGRLLWLFAFFVMYVDIRRGRDHVVESADTISWCVVEEIGRAHV